MNNKKAIELLHEYMKNRAMLPQSKVQLDKILSLLSEEESQCICPSHGNDLSCPRMNPVKPVDRLKLFKSKLMQAGYGWSKADLIELIEILQERES